MVSEYGVVVASGIYRLDEDTMYHVMYHLMSQVGLDSSSPKIIEFPATDLSNIFLLCA